MTITDTPLENILKSLLQKNVKFNLGEKTIKKGKFMLFKQNNYCLEIMIQTKGNNLKKFEIPIPYYFEKWPEDKLIYFDYRFSSLARNKESRRKLFESIPKVGNNKFYNTILEIQIDS